MAEIRDPQSKKELLRWVGGGKEGATEVGGGERKELLRWVGGKGRSY